MREGIAVPLNTAKYYMGTTLSGQEKLSIFNAASTVISPAVDEFWAYRHKNMFRTLTALFDRNTPYMRHATSVIFRFLGCLVAEDSHRLHFQSIMSTQGNLTFLIF